GGGGLGGGGVVEGPLPHPPREGGGVSGSRAGAGGNKPKTPPANRAWRRWPPYPLSQADTLRRVVYWCCAQIEQCRDRLAWHCLTLAGYKIYQPLLREPRRSHGRKIIATPPLFPGYLFVWVVRGW